MAGLDPAINVFRAGGANDVDARHKAGHDENHDRPTCRSSRCANIVVVRPCAQLRIVRFRGR
jgi:hypothetical protein